MAIWLIRAGSHGEYEQKFIQENRVYVTWDNLDVNLAKLKQRPDLTAALTERYPDTKPKAIQNWVSQVWPFAHEMKKRDLVVLPLKSQPAIQIGEILDDYHFTKQRDAEADTSELEWEIDELVYTLDGRTPEEIRS